MDLIRKDCRVYIKDPADGSRNLWIIASTEEVDRDGDRILANGWRLENFLRNPVIPWAHRYDEPPVAKALETRIRDSRLIMLIKFATAEEYPFADTIFRLYKGGFLNAFSVGFKPLDSKPVERHVNGSVIRGRDYLEQELWEVSACVIPSNPGALVLARSKGILSGKDHERLSLESIISELVEKMIRERISNIIRRTIMRHGLDQDLTRHGII